MSEQKRLDLSKDQNKTKMLIENVIPYYLNGENMENALELIAYLRKNKMNPAQSSAISWKISYKSCVVCYFRFDLDTGALCISPIIGEYDHKSLSEDLKEIVWTNKKTGRHCERCHACSYILKTIFGREYTDACGQSISFTNLNINEIECIKELLNLRINIIKNGKLLPATPKNFG